RGEHGSAQLEQQWRTIEIRAERGAGTAARDDQKIQRELLDIQSVMIERHVPSSALPCSKLRLSGTFTGTFTGTFRKGIQGQTLVSCSLKYVSA
ncbi:MAG TPA: hypothetical protein VI072_00150, partial [Polyangiaceae bacterium]